MAEDQNIEEPKKKKGAGKALILILFLIIGGVVGAVLWQKYATEKKADAYLSEAKTFIENRRFNRAEETIRFADETLPGRPQTVEVEELLKTEKEIDQLEKDLVMKLREKDWDNSETILVSLKEIDAENVKISEGSEEIRLGRLSDKVDELEGKLSTAKGSDDLEGVLALSEELISLDPSHERSSEWESSRKNTVAEIEARNQKAKVIYEQATTLDEGVYNEELLFLATEAKTLSTDEKYETFFNKVNSYPRVISYPDDYPTLQGAVDAARAIDVIKITPGDYHSPVIINKEITMQGVEGEAVVIHCASTEGAAMFVGPEGDLTADYIMFKHSDLKEENESAYSVVVVEGKADFTACLFFESAGHGLHVTKGGKVETLSCRAEANTWDGLAVSGKGSEIKFQGSIAANNGHNGVDAWDGGKINLIDSFSEKNTRSGAVALGGGALTIKGSTIKQNSHAGLYVMSGGTAEVESSELSNNQLAGGYGDGSGMVKLTDTKILNNRVAGIVLAKGTTWSGLETLTYEGNEDKEVWKDAEFETLEDITAVVVEDESDEDAEENAAEESDTSEEETAPEE